jgi:hypothetical protein
LRLRDDKPPQDVLLPGFPHEEYQEGRICAREIAN